MADTILWRRLDLPGHEVGRLRPLGDGWELSGTALFLYEARPCRLDYRVACDAAGGRFVRTLEVDASGFVTSYPGLWEAEGRPTAT